MTSWWLRWRTAIKALFQCLVDYLYIYMYTNKLCNIESSVSFTTLSNKPIQLLWCARILWMSVILKHWRREFAKHKFFPAFLNPPDGQQPVRRKNITCIFYLFIQCIITSSLFYSQFYWEKTNQMISCFYYSALWMKILVQ